MISYTPMLGYPCWAGACETFRKRVAAVPTGAVSTGAVSTAFILGLACAMAPAPAWARQSPAAAVAPQPAASTSGGPDAARPVESPRAGTIVPASGDQTPPAVPAADAHAAAQPSVASQPAAPDGRAPVGDAHATQPAHAEAESHDESPWGLIARMVNFAILVGGLAYMLRGPLALHLQNRRQQISGDLDAARATAARATSQLAEIDQRLAQLPAELEHLRARGAEEIAAEEADIRRRADGERQRLLAQTRREIEIEVRLARRHLTEHAADLAVKLAGDRMTDAITDEDRERLLDRYVSRVKEIHG